MRESLGGLVSCLGTAAMLYALLPRLLTGPLGLLLLGGVGLFALLAVIAGIRRGVGLPRSIGAVVGVAALTVIATYGPLWYFTVSLAGTPLLVVPGK